MKAVIPVAGVGSRLRPLTYSQPKPLIPIAGKPIISFTIDKLLALGIKEYIFVIGYLGEKIKEYIELTYPDLDAIFITQEKRQGSAHALWLAKEAFKDADELVVFFGDTIIDANLSEFISTPGSALAVKKVKDPRQFGIVELTMDGKVNRLIEKPKIPKSDLAMVGVYKISEIPTFIDAMEFNISKNIQTNLEFPLTDALMRMVEKGIHFNIFPVDNWFDCGQKEVLLETNANFLDRDGYASVNLPSYDNSIIIHPISIGANCKITNSIIGPHVTIGDNVNIKKSILKNSIIGNYTSLKEIILHNSVIGNDTSVKGMQQSLNIGDNTEINFNQQD